MKKYLLLVTFLFLQNLLFAQTLTTEEKQKLIKALDSTDWETRWNAALIIRQDSVKEATPTIERVILDQDADIMAVMLETLGNFDSPNLHAIAKHILDSAEIIAQKLQVIGELSGPPFADAAYLKYQALRQLFKLGDFSDVAQCFAILNASNFNLQNYGNVLLPYVIRNVPSYAAEAKQKMLWIINNASVENEPFTQVRWHTLNEMKQIYGKDFIPDLIIIATTNSDPEVRNLALRYLMEFGYVNIRSLLVQQLHSEPNDTLRRFIAEDLLQKYGSPTNYVAYSQYLLTEQDTLRRFVKNYLLGKYIPPKPSNAFSVVTLLDTLKAYVAQSQIFSWLGNSHFATDLTKTLDEAKKHLTKKHADTKDSVKCAKEVRKFQKKVDEAYQKSKEKEKRREKFATVEGWKFLYYNAQYILDRLPALKKEEEEENK